MAGLEVSIFHHIYVVKVFDPKEDLDTFSEWTKCVLQISMNNCEQYLTV